MSLAAPPRAEPAAPVRHRVPPAAAGRQRRSRDFMTLALLALLALLPLLAHAPAWWEGRLLGPGDGAALHYPLRHLTWEAYRRGELPGWNPYIFLGTPLLAAYRAGALYPPMAAASLLPPFLGFQLLVLGSLSAAALLVFLYLRRLRAHPIGAYASALFFALGPYLTGHLGDSATLVAAPLLPLLLLAAESHVNRASPARAAGLAGALALLLLAGSPEASRAGAALVAGRLMVAHLLPTRGTPSPVSSVLALLAGGLLAAPQLVPTLLASREAGRSVTDLATPQAGALPGLTGLVLRYVSHTPAASLALAALPLLVSETPIRVLGVSLGLCLALQWGRGPLSAPSALALVFDLTLSVLAGLSLSAQWRARREAAGRRLRAYFLAASLASAAALSVAAAALGPLPQSLAAAVGVLALSLVLYHSLAGSPRVVTAGVWLLPLSVSFLLQPHGRRVWDGAPTRQELEGVTPTRHAIERVMGPQRQERGLTLARDWPREASDLAFANLGALSGRRSANGYDPMVPLRNRLALGSMGPGGTLPAAFLRTDPARLDLLGIRWVQVPDSSLRADSDGAELHAGLEFELEPGQARFFPVPIGPASEVKLTLTLAETAAVPQDGVLLTIFVHLASGRALTLPLRAARIEGRRYAAVRPLPGRYYVSGIQVESERGNPNLTLSRVALMDSASGRLSAVSLTAAYLSDTARLRELTPGPRVRLFEVSGSLGQARVVARLRPLGDDAAVLAALAQLTKAGVDPRREALAVAAESAGIVLPADSRPSRAELVRVSASRLEVRAEGPGLLVIAEGWDPGWTADVDGQASRIVRVNHVQMGIVLAPGMHRVVMHYRPRGFVAGFCLALLGAAGLGLALRRRGERDG